jgi:hypothetical protein
LVFAPKIGAGAGGLEFGGGGPPPPPRPPPALLSHANRTISSYLVLQELLVAVSIFVGQVSGPRSSLHRNYCSAFPLGSIIEYFLSAFPELPEIRIKDWENPARSAVVFLRSSFPEFLAAACVHLSATSPARFFWFNPLRHELMATNYDAFVHQCRSGIPPELFVAATTPPGSPVPSTSTHRSTKSKSSTGRPGQLEFREMLLNRDGNVCVLCRDVPEQLQLLEAAHIVPYEKTMAFCLQYGLPGANDVHNGVMLCKLCHYAFDRFLWYVRPDDIVVVVDAVLHDPGLATRWRTLVGRTLQRPTNYIKNSWWPSPLTWSFRADEFLKQQQKRWADFNDKKEECRICGQYLTVGRMLSHMSSKGCSRKAITGHKVFQATPKQYRVSGGSGADMRLEVPLAPPVSPEARDTASHAAYARTPQPLSLPPSSLSARSARSFAVSSVRRNLHSDAVAAASTQPASYTYSTGGERQRYGAHISKNVPAVPASRAITVASLPAVHYSRNPVAPAEISTLRRLPHPTIVQAALLPLASSSRSLGCLADLYGSGSVVL